MKRSKRLFLSSLMSLLLFSGTAMADPVGTDPTYGYFANTAANRTAEMSLYHLILSKQTLPNGADNAGSLAWYDYTNVSTDNYSRAAFYLELRNKSTGVSQWVLATTPDYNSGNQYNLGVPTYNGNTFADGALTTYAIQKVVQGTNVYISNPSGTATTMPLFQSVAADSNGVQTLSNQVGIIEMWPSNYGSGDGKLSYVDANGNTVNVSQNGGNHDWSDNSWGNGPGYGSYQIHLYKDNATGTKGQTLFAYNLYRSGHQVGIGTNPSGHPDWTFTSTANVYDIATLQVFVMPVLDETYKFYNGTGAWTDAKWLNSEGGSLTTPSVSDKAYIQTGHATVSADTTIATLGGFGTAELTVESGKTLTVTGNAIFDAATTIHLNGTLKASGGQLGLIDAGAGSVLTNTGTDSVPIESITGTSTTLNGAFTVSGLEISANTAISNTLTLSPSSQTTISGNLSGTGTINQTCGLAKLTGDNSGFSGTTTIQDGAAMFLASLGALPGSPTVKSGGAMTLNVGESEDINLFSQLVNKATFEPGSYLGVGIESNRTWAANLPDNANFAKSGAGTLTITGNGSAAFDGAVRIAEGAIQLGDGTTAGVLPGTVSLYSGTQFIFNNGAGSVTVSDGIYGPESEVQVKSGTVQFTSASKPSADGSILNVQAVSVSGDSVSLVNSSGKAASATIFDIGSGTKGSLISESGSISGTTVNLGSGTNGNGALIANGGTVSFTNINVGSNANSTGELTVAGGTVTGTVIAGNGANAAGTIRVSSGVLGTTGFDITLGNGGTSSQGTIEHSDGSVNVKKLTVGNNGTGVYNQTGGTLTIGGEVKIAQSGAGSSGVLTFTNGTSNGGIFDVGYQGNGTLNLYGDYDSATSKWSTTITTSSYFCAGNNTVDAFGTVNQYGGLNQSVWFPLGHMGKGVYNLYGGDMVCTGGNAGGGADDNNTFAIADRAGSEFTLNQSGGTIKAVHLSVGRNGTGVLNLSNGSINASGTIFVGNSSAGIGTLNQTGGSMSSAGFQVGNTGKGTFNQFDGNNKVTGTMTIGNGATGTGSYSISGGSLNANCIAVGDNGVGEFNISGGSVDAADWILCAFHSGSGTINQTSGDVTCGWFTLTWDGGGAGKGSGTYNMYGGTLTADGGGNDNRSSIGAVGTAEFNLYGGKVDIQQKKSYTDTLTLGAKHGATAQAGTGELNIYGGEMTVAKNVIVADGSSINFFIGSNGLGTLDITGSLYGPTATGATVTTNIADGLAFISADSFNPNTLTADVLKVGDASGSKVNLKINQGGTGGIYDAQFDADQGVLSVSFNPDFLVGTLSAVCGSSTNDSPYLGYIQIDELGNSNDPYVMTVSLNGLSTVTDLESVAAQMTQDLIAGGKTSALATAVPGSTTDISITGLIDDSTKVGDLILYNLKNANYLGAKVGSISSNQVPEPATWTLLVLGLFGLGWMRRRV